VWGGELLRLIGNWTPWLDTLLYSSDRGKKFRNLKAFLGFCNSESRLAADGWVDRGRVGHARVEVGGCPNLVHVVCVCAVVNAKVRVSSHLVW
jgi:hypothetical protein